MHAVYMLLVHKCISRHIHVYLMLYRNILKAFIIQKLCKVIQGIRIYIKVYLAVKHFKLSFSFQSITFLKSVKIFL